MNATTIPIPAQINNHARKVWNFYSLSHSHSTGSCPPIYSMELPETDRDAERNHNKHSRHQTPLSASCPSQSLSPCPIDKIKNKLENERKKTAKCQQHLKKDPVPSVRIVGFNTTIVKVF